MELRVELDVDDGQAGPQNAQRHEGGAVGIMVGGSLELIALGWMNVGAAMAPDSALASTVSTIIAVASVGDASSTKGAIAAAIGVAVPLAVAGQALTIFVRTIAIFFAHQADRFAEQANYRGIAIMHFTTLGLQGLRVAIPTAAVAALASGDTVKHALDAIPRSSPRAWASPEASSSSSVTPWSST